MPHDLGSALRQIVEREADHLARITEAQAALQPQSGKWSKKEELGHLVDSAANNHVRFVSASLQPEYRGPGYDQMGWVERHGYHQMPWIPVLELWRHYNLLLSVVIARIPDDRMSTPCVVGTSAPVTLHFLIEDYMLHMQHHLDHVLDRETITQYPPAKSVTP